MKHSLSVLELGVWTLMHSLGGKSMQGDEAMEHEEEEKYWVKRKAKLPNFNGSDPTKWLAQAKKFFKFHKEVFEKIAFKRIITITKYYFIFEKLCVVML